MSLIGVSASQGQGKTTVLNDLAKLGYNVIPQKTSRSILNEWNLTLNQVNSVNFLTQRFQDEIIKRHYNNITPIIDADTIHIQERTLADIFGYCINIMGPFNQFDAWLNQYYTDCKQLQQNYDCVIYLTGRKDFNVVDDGVRSTNKHFSNMMDMLIKHYVTDFDNGNVLYVDTPIHDERIKIIAEHLEKLKEKE